MYLTFISNLIESEITGKTKTLSYSNTDNIGSWQSKDLMYGARKDEMDKSNSYAFSMILQLYKIFYPANGDKLQEYNKNTKLLYDDWFSKVTKVLLKCDVRTSVLYVDINNAFVRKLYDELTKHHGYNRMTVVNLESIKFIWIQYTAAWDSALSLNRYKHIEITEQHHKDIVDAVNKLL